MTRRSARSWHSISPAILLLCGWLCFNVHMPAAHAQANLNATEKNTIEIFKRVSPSVVSVANRAILRDNVNMRLYAIPQGAGSGIIWDRKGHLISNFHVVYEARSIQVTLKNGRSYDATVVGLDPDHDIAVLKINAPEEELVPIEPGSSAGLQVGQQVMAIGNPFGLDTSLSCGVVSALGRTIVSMTGHPIYEVIQTDAAINPGNSGGPLLDSSGRLIGMNAAIMSAGGNYSGVGFAVPVDTISRIVPLLIAGKKMRRVGLGIQPLPDYILSQAGLKGMGILRVLPRGAAARAGLQGIHENRRGQAVLGDVVTGVDGTAITKIDDFLAIMERHQEGDEVSITYLRGEERRTAKIVLQRLEH